MAIMEENKMPELSPEAGSKPPSSTPAYFVIMHQPEGDEQKEERILVANQDVSAVAPVIQSGPNESKSSFLSADCTSGDITVTLDNNNMWNEFYRCSTEMILTKIGRRMFPYCRYWISGLSTDKKYILVMDITPLDNNKYKWNGKSWEPGGKAEPHVLGRVFIHPESPSTGEYWMHQPVSFYKLKLTNYVLDQEGHIILHSMHRYLPRLHVIPADKITDVIQLNGPDVHTFTFPQTEFFAVTAYQNVQITQLKIDCNPFARGFRDGTVIGRPSKDGGLKKILQSSDLPGSKPLTEDTEKIKEPVSMSEQSDADTENESFSAEKDAEKQLNSPFAVPQVIPPKKPQQQKDNDSLGDTSTMPVLPKSKEEPMVVKIKEEPEDDYDYGKAFSGMAVKVKQEDSEVPGELSNSDNDYPILEKHFARFNSRRRSGRKRSTRNPAGVAKTKLLKMEDDQMPTLYLESGFSQNTADNTFNSVEPIVTETLASNMPSIKEELIQEPIKRERRRRVQNKVYAEYYTPPSIKTNRGCKRKLPSPLLKSEDDVTPASESTMAPVPKRRGRPPKNKGAKVGLPSKKRLALEAPQLLPDFKPDLEDVDGVLFVAFSSKEALDVHSGGKSETVIPQTPPPAIPPPFPAIPPPSPVQPVFFPLTEEQQKISDLEKQLLMQLKTIRHRQVIHPSLQQVGLKLNIVDHAVPIDLWYLGVELPLPFISKDSRLENRDTSEGFSFVSRTGKTTDYKKIKGWRAKFSENSSVTNEGDNSETPLKNRSAFCSDELDEYLENEAKLMEDVNGAFESEPLSAAVSFQFPTKSTSYVRTLESVLKKQSSQLSSPGSLTTSKSSALPVKKRKYTRRRVVEHKEIKVEEDQRPCDDVTLQIALAETNVTCPIPKRKTKDVKTVFPKKEPVDESYSNSVTISNSNSVNISSSAPMPVKKRKYTRRAQTSQRKGKLKAEPSPLAILEIPDEPSPLEKQKTPNKPISTPLPSVMSPPNKLTPSPSVTSPVTSHPDIKPSTPAVESSVISPAKDVLSPSINQPHITHYPQKTLGLSKAQTKLLELEKHALWEGKPRTYVSEERAEVALSALLTAQASLKNKSVYKMINKRTECGNDFCRLGCVCSSLNQEKLSNAHCRQETCMLSCQCDNGSTFKEDIRNSSFVQEQGNELSSEGLVTKNDCLNSTLQSQKVFPIWDRSDVNNDPEPICIPEQGAVGYKTPHRKGTSERGKHSAAKHDGFHSARSGARPENLDSVNSAHPDMTCARVRMYKPKPMDETPRKDQILCTDSETPEKGLEHKLSKHTEREKENAGDHGTEKKQKNAEKSVSTKLLKIISECSWEQERRKILNIVSQRIDNKEPQSFTVGRFNIELTSEYEEGDTSKYSAISKMKISLAPDQKKDETHVKSPPEKKEKLPEKPPLDTSAEKEPKSYGGKGLPFYTKVLPAGKLVAHLKSSAIKQTELIQVNGKNYPQAKLVLGQMGALHPANRIAAYLTNKLQPGLQTMPKSNETSSRGGFTKASLKFSDGKLKDTKVVTSSKDKTVVQSVPKSASKNMEDVGNCQGNIPGTKSNEASLPKLQLLVSNIGSSSNQVQVVSSVNVATKLVTTSCVTLPTKTIPAASSVNITKMSTLVLSPPKESVPTTPIPPPALIRAPCQTVTSSVPLSGTDKTLAASVASSLVASANLPTIGAVGSPPRVPTVTLRTVTPPAVLKPRPVLTPEANKHLGPRLLLIPVPTNSTSLRPIQCVQTSPGQRMVLQPIKSPNGINLFRHPNGQLIQLVPLHQVQGKNLQASQQVVIGNQVPSINIQLPLQTKHDASTPTSATNVSSVVSPLAPLIVSPPKISPNKSGVATVLLGTSTLPQIKDGVPTTPKAYTTSGNTVLTSAAISLTSGGHPVLKIPLNTPLKSSNDIAIANVIAVTEKPAILVDKKSCPSGSLFKSASPVLISEEKMIEVDVKQNDSLNPGPVQVMGKESSSNADQNTSGSENNSPMLSNNTEMVTAHKKDGETQKAIVDNAIQQDDNNEGPSNSSKKASQSSGEDNLQSTNGRIASKNDQHTNCPAYKSTDTSGDRSPVESFSESRANEVQSSTGINMEVQALSKYKKSEDGQESEGPSLTDVRKTIMERDKDAESSSNSKESEPNSEDESEADESVDIETVEELSEKNLARLKATSNTELTDGKGIKTEPKGSEDEASDSNRRNRHAHNAKERIRRNEMRDLFEELKNALGLHNIPKACKSYLLKKAIEEIKGLTDEADSLMRQKTMVSQIQTQLIKKVSNLSGKSKGAVLKNLHAKQHNLTTDENKKDFKEEEEVDIETTENNSSSLIPLALESKVLESSSIITTEPIIHSKKPTTLSKMQSPEQSAVTKAPSTLLPSTDQPVSLQHPETEIQAAGITTLPVEDNLKPPQMETENDLSFMPKIVHVMSLAEEASSGLGSHAAVTTGCTSIDLTEETAECVDLTEETAECVDLTKETAEFVDLTEETAESVGVSDHGKRELPSTSSSQSTCLKSEDNCLHKVIPGTHSLDFGPLVDLTLPNITNANAESSSSVNNLPSVEDATDSRLEMEFKKLSSAIEDAVIEPGVLSVEPGVLSVEPGVLSVEPSVLSGEPNVLSGAPNVLSVEPTVLSVEPGVLSGDHEDSDETMTSLFNEIELLNQHLNIDHADFPGSDTASQSSICKSGDGDSSPFFFGRFKELSESKENLLLSPLFLSSLRDGEIQDSMKSTEEPSILVFDDGLSKEVLNTMDTPCELQNSAIDLAPLPAVEKPAAPSTSDAFWRPMPKLAPLGLKSPTLMGDQRVLLNKSMPSLASAAVPLNSPKPME